MRRFARALWWIAVVVIVVMTVLSVPINVGLMHQPCPTDSCRDWRLTADQLRSMAALGLSRDAYTAFFLAINLIPPLVYLVVAFVLFQRRSDDAMAYFTALTLVVFGGVTYSDFQEQLAVSNAVWTLPVLVLQYLGSVFLVVWIFTFPTGRVVPRWARYVVCFWVVEQVLDTVSKPPLDLGLIPPPLTDGAFVLVFIVAMYSQLIRYRRTKSFVQRRQTKWVVFGIVMGLGTQLVAGVLYYAFALSRSESLAAVLVFYALQSMAAVFIPISIAGAILRDHLYDIDLLVNRTFFYGSLTAILTGVMAVSVELSKRTFLALTGQSSEFTPILATLVVVSSFDPIKKRVERTVDTHFKYPTHSFGAFGAKLREFIELSDPPALASAFLNQAMSQFGASSGAVYLGSGDRLALVDRGGAADAEPALSIALRHDGRLAGLISLGERLSGDDYSPEDRRSLEEVGGLVARSILLVKSEPGGSAR